MSRELSPAAVQRAVTTLADGGMVVVIDDADRENEGDLVVAAELVTEGQMAFVVRHSTGIVCAPMPPERAETCGCRRWSATTPTPTAPRSP